MKLALVKEIPPESNMNTEPKTTGKTPVPPLIRLCIKLTLALLVTVSTGAVYGDTTLIPAGATWKYLDNGSNQGTAWRESAFNDGSWKSGPAELGYGDGGEATIVSYGSNSSAKYITTYFRHTFQVPNPTLYAGLRLRLMRDDGAVVYLNGKEIFRSNMPTGTVSYTTLASTAVSEPDESAFFQTAAANTLVAGANVLAVELHQANGTSTDVSFDFELQGVTDTSAAAVTRGPYLQNATPSSMVIRWRTDFPTNSKVWFGSSVATLTSSKEDLVSTTEHEVQITGLTPNTQYYYAIGSTSGQIASGSEYTFFTPPTPGTIQPIRVWVLGDSGTANADAAAVRNAYNAFNGNQYTDLWLMLGDNAYNNGTDSEYQAGVFNMYPSMLRQSPLWSALGNHETYTQNGAAYFNSFTFPTAGEAGGEPSGTEKYYSFDYGNVHFICLDSMSSDRSATGAMATWLQADLAATTQDWIIAFWHHPPYTKGSHDSDSSTGADPELVEMRQNFLPLLEAGGVDLVLSGHSHSYERSYLIDGHYGLSTTFSGSMKKDPGNGQEVNGTGAYRKPLGLTANQGAVYAVAGSSGKISNWWGGSTALVNPTPHPAMVTSLLKLGSLVLDLNDKRLDVKFLDSTGTVADQFTISKDVSNMPPTIAISSPASGATVNAPVTVSAAASDEDGSVVQVDFYDGDTVIGSDTSAPFEITWTNAAVGNHVLTATAIDNLGATTTSAAVNITVNAPPTVSITSPAANSVFTTPASITITANAADDGGIAKVVFYAGSSLIGEATSAPYSVTWTNVAAGTYQLTAVATDNVGAAKTSAAVTVTVKAPNVAPSVSLTSPTGSEVFTAPATVNLAATASDTDGTVTKVEFYSGSQLIATDTTAPFSYSLSNVAAGSYTFKAVATDNAGATTSSTSVNVTVNPPPAPAAPSNLTAAGSKPRIDLAWTDNSNNETGFYIERSTSSTFSTGVTKITVGANTKSYRDSSATSGTTYYYRVQSYNASGTSAYTNTASAARR